MTMGMPAFSDADRPAIRGDREAIAALLAAIARARG